MPRQARVVAVDVPRTINCATEGVSEVYVLILPSVSTRATHVHGVAPGTTLWSA